MLRVKRGQNICHQHPADYYELVLSSQQHHYVLLWPPINQELAQRKKEFVQGSERRKTKETRGYFLEGGLKQSSREGWVFTSQTHQENSATCRLTCTELCRRLHTAQTLPNEERGGADLKKKKFKKSRHWCFFWGEDITAHQKLLPEGCQLYHSEALPPFPVDRNFSLVSSFIKAILV